LSFAAEVLVVTPAIRALIRDDKVHQIYSLMQSGKKFGMQTMNDALYQLYMAREVAEEECLRVTSDPNEFLRLIGKSPVEGDTGARDAPGSKPGGSSSSGLRRRRWRRAGPATWRMWASVTAGAPARAAQARAALINVRSPRRPSVPRAMHS
jgi:hypothetical protein